MPRVTRFAARAAGPAERLSGFLAHLRANGLAVGPAETASALAALGAVRATEAGEARLALRAVLAGSATEAARFDLLFDAYWRSEGRARRRAAPSPPPRDAAPPPLWRRALDGPEDGPADPSPGAERAPDPTGDAPAEGDGRRALEASASETRARRDPSAFSDPATLAEAGATAARLARALRDRRSRRARAARRGARPDLRRTIRRSLSRGGEPVEILSRRRPDRPVHLVALVDVSASMTAHARLFMAFARGLVGSGVRTEVFAFHTRLVPVTEALAARDPMAAAERLALLSEGFAGGTDIGAALGALARGRAARRLTRRTVVLVISDGHCSGPPDAVATALARLRRRAGRIAWLDPLHRRDAGTRPAALAAALPHLDAHLPADGAGALAALEPAFARL